MTQRTRSRIENMSLLALPTVARGVGAYESSLWKGDSSMVILHRLAAPPADTSVSLHHWFELICNKIT